MNGCVLLYTLAKNDKMHVPIADAGGIEAVVAAAMRPIGDSEDMRDYGVCDYGVLSLI